MHTEGTRLSPSCFAARALCVSYTQYVYMQHMYSLCLIMYCLLSATILVHTHKVFVWAVRVCPFGFVCNCRVTYSLLGAALVLASGWTRPRRALDLTRAMFSGTPPWLILTELLRFKLQQTRVPSHVF